MSTSSQFRHARFYGNGEIKLELSPLPAFKTTEVLVKVQRTALCGSDNRLWRDGAAQIPGHEIFGVVDQPGHARHSHRVCIYIPVYCGECTACTAGHTQSCETQSILVGWNRDGGFAEYVQVPEQCLLPVPDTVCDRTAPLLLDTIGTSAHAVRYVTRWLGKLPGKRILITGGGPIGMGVLLALMDIGATKIILSEPVAERREFANSLGVGIGQVMDTNVDGRFDVVFECSGAHAARDLAITSIAPGGAIVLIGENNKPWAIQEGPVFRRKDFALLRSFYFPVSEHQDNIDLLLRHTAMYERIADIDISLEQLPDAYTDFVNGKTMKPLLTFAGI